MQVKCSLKSSSLSSSNRTFSTILLTLFVSYWYSGGLRRHLGQCFRFSQFLHKDISHLEHWFSISLLLQIWHWRIWLLLIFSMISPPFLMAHLLMESNLNYCMVEFFVELGGSPPNWFMLMFLDYKDPRLLSLVNWVGVNKLSLREGSSSSISILSSLFFIN